VWLLDPRAKKSVTTAFIKTGARVAWRERLRIGIVKRRTRMATPSMASGQARARVRSITATQVGGAELWRPGGMKTGGTNPASARASTSPGLWGLKRTIA